MSTPISSIRNLGPAMQTAFIEAGIPDAESLRALGPDAAYARLVETGTRPHFIAYYAMVMGLQDRAWNDLSPQEKTELRARFDAIKARCQQTTPLGIEAHLDKIGTGQRR